MAIIKYYYRNPGDERHTCEIHEFDGMAWQWIVENLNQGQNFQVYEGGTSKECEISRDLERMKTAVDVSIIDIPGGGVLVPLVVSVIVSVAVVLLTPKAKALDNVNRQQESPNNSLTNRENTARPNQRIVDICGQVKSIPDVIQPEWARFVNGTEERTGAYCVGRKQILIEDLKDSDTTFEESGQSAGIYYPFKSPNNSAPDVQIGDPINQPIVGVFESSDALDQTLKAANDAVVALAGTGVRIYSTGVLTAGANIDQTLQVGDTARLKDVLYNGTVIGDMPLEVIQVSSSQITFDITNDPSWSVLPPGANAIDQKPDPRIERLNAVQVGPFEISSIKIDRFIFNAYAPNGMYKENTNGRREASVTYRVYYQKLNDNLDPVGPETPVEATVIGQSADLTGATVDVDLGGPTFLRWRAERVTDKNYSFNGTVVDDIKIRSVFGLYDVDKEDFGDITMIQTQRKAIAETVLIKSPEVNCIATEMVNKYQGSGVFDPVLTPNTQGMQTLIRLALDERVGRRQIDELDADLLIDLQDDIETYFQSPTAGSFNYSFDSTNTTAQETIFSILNAIFCVGWREGRVLKASFERPQTVPFRVFTHGSKQPNSETWTRNFDRDNDSIEFAYTDATFYTQEILTIPEDGSGTNPKKVEIPGIKGLEHATWRAYREYNKLIYSEISVDFSATEEGRLVKPNQMISVVKGARVASYDGYIRGLVGLELELSDEVVFTQGDDHFILLKKRDGTVESIPCFDIGKPRFVQLGFFPIETPYFGNDESKTEFSFGNEARLKGQWILPQSIDPSNKQYVAISGINYSDLYYQNDTIQPIGKAFDDGFSDGFS